MAASTWTQLSPANVPSALDDFGLAWDASRNLVIRAGGNNPGIGANQTETWDGTNWANDGATPTQRRRPAVVYDVPRAEVVVFGGISAGVFFGLTHTRGASWALESPATSPGTRAGAYGAYCSAISQSIIFGGSASGATYHDETWGWNGTTWAQITTANAPSGRENCLICSWGTGVLLFGGNDLAGVTALYDDTWLFDGTDWTELAPATTPPARTEGGLSLYETLGKAIMFGGFGNTGVYLNDTWSWDGTDWTLETPSASPPTRASFDAVWDGVNGGILIWGGDLGATTTETDETWLFTYAPEEGVYTIHKTIGLG